ncbi:MAG: hypothetical protein EA401_03905 [Planctomycetota bacterium]|nr:MAG: hypothetical protein EA401_03905 [Planctomycetota bacterium]
MILPPVSQRPHSSGIVLILITIVMVMLAVLTTAFLSRMRATAGAADDVLAVAQNRIHLVSAMTYIQERSRLGYATMNPSQPWLTDHHREGHGWVDVRTEVPLDNDADTAGGYTRFADQGSVVDDNGSTVSVPSGVVLTEHITGRRIGPRAADGRILWPYRVRRMQSVLRIEVDNAGSGYTSPPTVTISSPQANGHQARARAVVREGRVVRIEIDEPGWGYSSQPTVQVEGPATAVATWGAWSGSSNWENYRFVAAPTQSPQWPAPGSITRVPLYRQQRPPFAVAPTVVANPIPTDHTLPTFDIPFFTNPDPMPLVPPEMAVDPLDPASGGWQMSWAQGDVQPVTASTGRGWFRIYRETGYEADRPVHSGPPGSTFVITVGSGGTMGYRDWDEVVQLGAQSQFDHDRDMFALLLSEEQRHWYRVEWSGSVGGGEESHYASPLAEGRTAQPQPGAGGSWYEILPPNSSRFIDVRSDSSSAPNVYQPSPAHPRNYLGTIRYIQRLDGDSIPEMW